MTGVDSVIRGDLGVDPGGEAARRLAALARWRKRSQQVRFFRVALPWAMVALVLFGVGWVLVRAIVGKLNAGGEAAATIHLLHPTFYGRNDRKEPYILYADQAVRGGDDPNRIALAWPRLKQFTGAPQPQIVTADRGVYLEKQRLMDLFGHVRASDGQGYHFASDFAHVDMPKNSVTGRSAMSGYGPSGTVRADAYTILDKGQHIVLRGDVRTHLVNIQSATPNAAHPKH